MDASITAVSWSDGTLNLRKADDYGFPGDSAAQHNGNRSAVWLGVRQFEDAIFVRLLERTQDLHREHAPVSIHKFVAGWAEQHQVLNIVDIRSRLR